MITVREFIEADDFYKYSHRVIFKAMVTLSDRNDAIDATTVRTILDDQDDLQNIGGISYLVDLVNSVPTSANAEYYAKIVAEKAMLRRIINRLTETVNQAYEGATESDEIIANAEKALVDVSEHSIVVVSAKYLKFLMSILILWRCVHSKHQMLLGCRQVSVTLTRLQQVYTLIN